MSLLDKYGKSEETSEDPYSRSDDGHIVTLSGFGSSYTFATTSYVDAVTDKMQPINLDDIKTITYKNTEYKVSDLMETILTIKDLLDKGRL